MGSSRVVKGPRDGSRAPLHHNVNPSSVRMEQKPAPCENSTTMASLLSDQSIHEEAFRLLSNFIVTCSTRMSISVTANPSNPSGLSDWAAGPVLGGSSILHRLTREASVWTSGSWMSESHHPAPRCDVEVAEGSAGARSPFTIDSVVDGRVPAHPVESG